METEHPYRLRSIEIDDFKSIRHANIDLLPLSVIVGANSSGKSSLLQVILAISQAVRSRSVGATFPLNGEYARFGTFDETVRFKSSKRRSKALIPRNIRMRVTLADTEDLAAHHDEEGEDTDPPDPLLMLYWCLDLTSNEDSSGGTAKIDSVSLRCYRPSEDSEPQPQMQYQLQNLADIATGDRDAGYRVFAHGSQAFAHQELTATDAAYFEQMEDDELSRVECDAVGLRGAIPAEVYTLSTFAEAVGRHWWNAATVIVPSLSTGDPSESTDEDMQTDPKHVEKECLRSMIDSAGKAAHRFHDTWSDRTSSRRFSPIFFQMQSLLGEQLQKEPDTQEQIAKGIERIAIEDFLRGLGDHLAEYDWAQDKVWNPQEDLFHRPSIAWSNYCISQFFDRSIKYLGPLRKAPQVLYDPKLRDRDLGLSGEYTAAILHANSDHQVKPVSSDESDRVALADEVDVWLNRFGLATQAVLTDRRRLGIGLHIKPLDSERSVDLTSVGVGVSQVLPVIVLCLLAEPGDMVILEQPELHLHPALQQQLGDFLLDCAKSGRQVLIETHSEHLVNRVRRRVADPSGADEGMVSLLFAEQISGVTELRQSVIDPYGGSESDWPSGFFDVSATEAQALVSTSLTKRFRDAH